MTNRTDWEELAKEIVQTWLDEDTRNLRVLRDRIETELHNAWVAGREGSPEVWAQFSPPQIHIENITMNFDDPDRLAFGIAAAFTKKVTGEMAIPTDFGPLTIKSDPTVPPGEIRFEGYDRVPVSRGSSGFTVLASTDPAAPVTEVDLGAVLGGPPGGPGEIDGLTPGECRDRWEANAAAIESGMARPYALSPGQIAEGKRLHLARKAGR